MFLFRDNSQIHLDNASTHHHNDTVNSKIIIILLVYETITSPVSTTPSYFHFRKQ